MKYIISFLILTLLSSCGEDFSTSRIINIDFKPQLVVYGTLYAGNHAEIEIKRTYPAAGPLITDNGTEDRNLVKNATVYLINSQNQRIPFVYSTEEGAYFNPTFIPVVGQTYKLEVNAPTFNTVTGSTTVIDNNITVKDISFITAEFRNNHKDYQFTLVDSSAKEYYVLYAKNNISDYTDYTYGFDTKDPFLTQYASGGTGILINLDNNDKSTLFEEGAFFNDETINNKETILKLTTEYKIQISKITQEFFNYKVARFKQEENLGNPLGETATLPTNLVGGLGFFTSINPISIQ